MKWVWIGLGVVAALLVLVIALGSLVEDEPTGNTNTNGQQKTQQTTVKDVGVPVITNAVDEDTQEPVRKLDAVPLGTKAIYAAIQVNVKKGQTLSSKWFYEAQYQSQLDSSVKVPEDFQGWASFHIKNDTKAWPAGNYIVEIYLDGQLKQQAKFAVK